MFKARKDNENLSSIFLIEGEVKNNWFFENSCEVSKDGARLTAHGTRHSRIVKEKLLPHLQLD
jgi:hypothetical protein